MKSMKFMKRGRSSGFMAFMLFMVTILPGCSFPGSWH